MSRVLGRFVRAWLRQERSAGLLHPLLFAVTVAVHVAEQREGRDRNAKAVGNDLAWWLITSVASATVHELVGRSGVAPGRLRRSPVPRVLIGFVGVDFCRWASHVARHKVPGFWEFHAVHHASEQVGGTSSFRVHPVDRIAGVVLTRLAMRALRVNPAEERVSVLARNLLGRTHHAAVDLDFSRLGKVGSALVRPSDHRVHHSPEVAHFDKNYGEALIVWDRLFGTYVEPESIEVAEQAVDGHMATGLDDIDDDSSIFSQLVMPLRLALERADRIDLTKPDTAPVPAA